jgi:hypothetical protein
MRSGMPVRVTRRARLTVAGVALAVAGAAVVTAGPAAVGAPGTSALHVTYRVSLGHLPGFTPTTVAEASDGAVFYARGSVVYVVEGHATPVAAEHTGATVLAVAANASDLFVESGHTVTEYRRSGGSTVAHWSLSSPQPPTQAGLLLSDGVVWVWTDWATDESGFQYATLSRIRLGSPTVHVVSTNAYPGDLDADATALFYERQGTTRAYVVRVSPAGTTKRSAPQAQLDAPMAVDGARVVLLAQHGTRGKTYADSYRITTLAKMSSKLVPQDLAGIADTGAGLLVVVDPCTGLTCAAADVRTLNPATGAATGGLAVPHAYDLLKGHRPGVVTLSRGVYTLVRLS